MDRSLKCDHAFIGKLLSGAVFFNFLQCVILENLSFLDLVLLGANAMKCYSKKPIPLQQ